MIAPDNAARGLDPHQGAVLLHDGETGVLRAVLNASAITEIRTAAVSAVATKLLARRSRQVAILGAGVQARSHAEAMRTVIPDLELRVWSRTSAHAEALALEATPRSARRSRRRSTARTSSALCTAPRASRAPRLARAWSRTSRSAPPFRRLASSTPRSSPKHPCSSTAASRRSNESGDYLRAVEERGIGPSTSSPSLGELIVGAHPGRRDASELTLFKSLGLAVEDLAAGVLCVERARERGIGTEVPF